MLKKKKEKKTPFTHNLHALNKYVYFTLKYGLFDSLELSINGAYFVRSYDFVVGKLKQSFRPKDYFHTQGLIPTQFFTY